MIHIDFYLNVRNTLLIILIIFMTIKIYSFVISFRIDDKIISMKEKIDLETKKLGLPLYLYFQDNFSIEKIVMNRSSGKITSYGDKKKI